MLGLDVVAIKDDALHRVKDVDEQGGIDRHFQVNIKSYLNVEWGV